MERPRGPNQTMSRRLRGSSPRPVSATASTAERTPRATAAKAMPRQVSPVSPVQINELPNATKVKSRNISAAACPKSRKQSHRSASAVAMVSPAANAARKPLPCAASAAA